MPKGRLRSLMGFDILGTSWEKAIGIEPDFYLPGMGKSVTERDLERNDDPMTKTFE
jgi:hypothetical protein